MSDEIVLCLLESNRLNEIAQLGAKGGMKYPLSNRTYLSVSVWVVSRVGSTRWLGYIGVRFYLFIFV